MKNILLLLSALFIITGCNSMYVKPGTLDKNQTVFADSGGYSMKRSIKQEMEKRGYKVVVGKTNNSIDSFSDDSYVNINSADTMNARYVVKVAERRELFFPIWCMFNGFWWWNFNISIADQKTGDEILSWRGRGCANSSMEKLDNVLTKLER